MISVSIDFIISHENTFSDLTEASEPYLLKTYVIMCDIIHGGRHYTVCFYLIMFACG